MFLPSFQKDVRRYADRFCEQSNISFSVATYSYTVRQLQYYKRLHRKILRILQLTISQFNRKIE